MMHRLLFLTALACSLVLVPRASLAQDVGFGSKNVTLTLSTDPAKPQAGQAFQLTAKVVIAPQFHIYGKTLQGIGKPTVLKISLPEGWEQETLPWPPTKAVAAPDGPTQAYTGTVLISVKVTPKAGATSGKIGAVVDGLACSDQMCVPFKAAANLSVPLQ